MTEVLPRSSGSLELMCTLAVRRAFDRVLVPDFERTGPKTSVTWAPTTMLTNMIAAGRTADAIVLVSEAMDRLVEQGVVDAGTRIDVARSGLGLAVAANSPHPDVSSVAAFQQALLSARSVAYSQAGASGIYFRQLIDRLGIADAINAGATVISTGFTAEKLITGEADLAIQQMSELMAVPGVEIVGRFPASLQTFITISAAVFNASQNTSLARAFLDTLGSDRATAAYLESGLDTAASGA